MKLGAVQEMSTVAVSKIFLVVLNLLPHRTVKKKGDSREKQNLILSKAIVTHYYNC